MGISIVPLEGVRKGTKYLKKLEDKKNEPAMMFDPNLQQKTPDVGADKPKTKKKKKKKDDDLISVKTGGYLKKRVYGAKLGEKMVADSYKNGKSK